MTDVYRTSGLACPSCPGASLRAFADRYICDECGGMLIGFDDFERALADLLGEHPDPRYDYGARSKRACPRCTTALVEVAIVIAIRGRNTAFEPFLRCERDGLWCAGGVLERVFEEVSRKGHDGFTLAAGLAPAVGPDGLPRPRFVPSTAERRRHETPRAPSVDPFADRTLACPSCRERLAFQHDRWSCAECGGALVGNDALVEMVQDIAGRYWELPPITASPGPRACPVCASALATAVLEGVAVDRCAEHGVWFDAGELAAALAASTEDDRSWFARVIKPRR